MNAHQRRKRRRWVDRLAAEMARIAKTFDTPQDAEEALDRVLAERGMRPWRIGPIS